MLLSLHEDLLSVRRLRHSDKVTRIGSTYFSQNHLLTYPWTYLLTYPWTYLPTYPWTYLLTYPCHMIPHKPICKAKGQQIVSS